MTQLYRRTATQLTPRSALEIETLLDGFELVPPGVVFLSLWRPDSPALFVSVITIGEIRRGIAKLQLRNDHRQAVAYESWLADTEGSFTDRLVPISVDAAEEWGRIDADHPISMSDGLIAATAKVRGWTERAPFRRADPARCSRPSMDAVIIRRSAAAPGQR
ncbi:MAG: SAM-dependent methyltransferase [Pseudonocardiaceae bacterium]